MSRNLFLYHLQRMATTMSYSSLVPHIRLSFASHRPNITLPSSTPMICSCWNNGQARQARGKSYVSRAVEALQRSMACPIGCTKKR